MMLEILSASEFLTYVDTRVPPSFRNQVMPKKWANVKPWQGMAFNYMIQKHEE